MYHETDQSIILKKKQPLLHYQLYKHKIQWETTKHERKLCENKF